MHARNFALAALLVAASTVSCIGQVDPDDEAEQYRQALPDAQALQIKLPGAMEPLSQELEGEGVGSSQQALIGETAKFYEVTRDISYGVNGATYHWLSMIDDIASQPPTNIVHGTAYWGPHTPALSLITFMFVMSFDGDETYEYALLGKVKNQPDDAYLPIVEGTSTPGHPGIGHGTMRLHFDNRRLLDPTFEEDGLIELAYVTVGTYWTLDMHFADFVGEDNPLDPLNAMYHYRENADESGDFAFLAHEDIDDNGSSLETWHMHSRWLAGGSGRGDAIIVGGDLGDVQVFASECWNEMFARTYWEVDPAYIEPAEGDAASCVFPAPNHQL